MCVLAVLATGAHLAREGTTTARLGVGLACLLLAIALLVRVLVRMRIARDARRATHELLRGVDPALAARAQRAVGLVHDERQTDPIARSLAQLHLDRILAGVSPLAVEERAQQRASRWRLVALGFGAVALGAFVAGPVRVIEGLDVLLANNGRAPVPLLWVEDVVGEVQVPAYLREPNRTFFGLGPVAYPRGSVLVLHGRPVHEGRKLVLRAGDKEVPFADDGAGGLVARWVLGDSTKLEIGARFGDVIIPQADTLDVTSIPDETPRVNVAGAPRTDRLLEITELPVRYEASDDHGLTQIDLVLRSGEQEERRVLARHDGHERQAQGSTVLRPDDAFFVRAYVPIEVTVEARDNDPITGPKWGASKVLTLMPPNIGEAEALRFEALRAIRDQAVDLLATNLELEPSHDALGWQQQLERRHKQQGELAVFALDAMLKTYGGLEVPRRTQALLAGYLDRLDRSKTQPCTPPQSPACVQAQRRVTDSTAETVLGIDMALASLSTIDAVRVAKRLADVAEDAARGAKLVRQQDRDRGEPKLRASMVALDGGAQSLGRLDGLGDDLSEVVGIGVRRIDRCIKAADYICAEWAALDLAARLRKPFPSFSGGGGRGATEAGGTPSLGESSNQEAEQALNEQDAELEQLAREHAAQLEQLRQELAQASQQADMQALQQEAQDRARQLREQTSSLPDEPGDLSSARGAASLAKNEAEAMAEALERLALQDAASSGKAAMRSAEQARQLADRESDLFGNASSLRGELARAQQQLNEHTRWVEEQLQKQRQAAMQGARERMQRAARQEQDMAQRAQRLAQRGRQSEAPMPESTLQMLEQARKTMQQAADALRALEAERGMDQQREAQRLLEMAREAQGTREPSEPEQQAKQPAQDSEEGDGRIGTGHVDIPGADRFHGPEEFRRRVLEGLRNTNDPRLREAVRRYAEGLLR